MIGEKKKFYKDCKGVRKALLLTLSQINWTGPGITKPAWGYRDNPHISTHSSREDDSPRPRINCVWYNRITWTRKLRARAKHNMNPETISSNENMWWIMCSGRLPSLLIVIPFYHSSSSSSSINSNNLLLLWIIIIMIIKMIIIISKWELNDYK